MPAVSLPSLKGKTVVVTGANTGIGRIAAEKFAGAGARVVLACRTLDRTQPVIDGIRQANPGAQVEFIALNLNSLQGVRTCADEILALNVPIDILVNNAGLAGQRGITDDGFELAFGVNHLGHFLLTQLLLDRVLQAPASRIVNVASRAHFQTKGIDFQAVRQSTPSATGIDEYAVSKLANVLHAAELARRIAHTSTTVASLHPGVVATDVWRSLPSPLAWIAKKFMISPEEGANTTLYCATAPEVAANSGAYWDNCAQKRPSHAARDQALATELWQQSEAWTKAFAG
jgi:retinol dehydrogenase 12